MKISIVTNAFNQGKFLAAAMQSVLTQQGVDLEYVVVDPGSTDNTAEVISTFSERYPGRITVIREKDAGPADGLNKAFSRCSGDIFGYLNADDVYLPGCLSAAAKAMTLHPQSAAVYGDGYLVDEHGKCVRRAVSFPYSSRRFVYGCSFVLQQSTFYRADVFRKLGGFNKDNWTSWDAELLMDMDLAGYTLTHVAGYWSLFRIHGSSITGSQRLAAESRKNHARYFKRLTGRDRRNSLDRLLRGYTRVWARVLAPRAAAVRMIDAVAPSSRVFQEAGFSLRDLEASFGGPR